MSFFEIDTNFVIPNNFNISMLTELSEHKIIYGQPQELNPTTAYWSTYYPYHPGGGSISFVRRMHLQFPDVAEYIMEYISKFFPKLPVLIERVGIMRTVGSVSPHVDEGGRKSCINIGIQNSIGAKTKVSATTDKELYKTLGQVKQCHDNCSYLLDTSCRHEVIGVNNNPRYLFTYGLGISFFEVMKFYRNPT